MNAVTEIILESKNLGVTIEAVEGNLHCKPTSRLTPELLQKIRQYKAQLLTSPDIPGVVTVTDFRGWEPEEEGPHPVQEIDQQQVSSNLNEPVTTSLLDDLESMLGYPVQPGEWKQEPPVSTDVDGWDLLSDDQRERLLNPPEQLPACHVCGRHNVHTKNCPHEEMVMPIGKKKGKQIRTLASRYLRNFLSIDPKISPEVKREIQRELHIRGNQCDQGRPAKEPGQ